MRFTPDQASPANLVRGYGVEGIRINEHAFATTVLVSAATLLAEPAVHSVADLDAELAARIKALRPEVVLIGTGARQTFPAAVFGAVFLEAGIGFEVMDTGAACRTYNVLVGEQRQVVALLMV